MGQRPGSGRRSQAGTSALLPPTHVGERRRWDGRSGCAAARSRLPARAGGCGSRCRWRPPVARARRAGGLPDPPRLRRLARRPAPPATAAAHTAAPSARPVAAANSRSARHTACSLPVPSPSGVRPGDRCQPTAGSPKPRASGTDRARRTARPCDITGPARPRLSRRARTGTPRRAPGDDPCLLPSTPRCTSRERHDDASITSWALAARSGDPEAVDRFVRALQRDVRRYVIYLSSDPQAADDLTQETFLRALGSLHRFEGRSSARTWPLSIARRTVVDSLLRYAAARPRLGPGGRHPRLRRRRRTRRTARPASRRTP